MLRRGKPLPPHSAGTHGKRGLRAVPVNAPGGKTGRKERDAMEHKILLIEDDESICEMLTGYLSGENFTIRAFHTAEDAMAAFEQDRDYALALVDLMLPDKSGMDVIKFIRRTSTLPIIILTARDSDADKSLGLNLGADDYVVKPFSLIELTARMRANIRRATRYDGRQEDALIRVRDLEIDVAGHTARAAGTELELTRTEFEILCLLASHPGQAFSKERLYGLVWKEPYFGNENVLNTHINRLRAKLKACSDGVYIKTLWGIGYRMEGE